jgi:hypothetical protein
METKAFTARDLYNALVDALAEEHKARVVRARIETQIKDKEREIAKTIIKKLVDKGSHESNLEVHTTILLAHALVEVQNWNYYVSYRDGELEVSNRDIDILDKMKLSELNMVFEIIKEVVTEEGLT